MRKYDFNRRFFQDIDTEAKAYFLGLLGADGWLKYDKRNGTFQAVCISLKDDDVAILEQFRSSVDGQDLPIRFYATQTGYGQCNIARLTLRSVELCSDLLAKGFCLRKHDRTQRLSRYVPTHLHRHLVRGLMDGDGGPSLERKPRKRLRFSLRGALITLQDVQAIAPMTLRLTKDKWPRLYTSSRVEAAQLASWMYDDAHIYLERKYNLYVSALA